VGEVPENRLIAWNRELLATHERLRAALRITRQALESADFESVRSDIRLYCHGFCVAITGHHVGEDSTLFAALLAENPALEPVVARLAQDHDMIAALVRQLDDAMQNSADPQTLRLHLDGLSAIVDSHFGYEERQLLRALAVLNLIADPRSALGPL
jgi:hemerythrin-like domain-containing protein